MLLSEQELRSALEPLLDRLLVERFKYFQLQLEARLTSLMEAAWAPPAPAAVPGPNARDDGWQRLLRANDANEVFEILFAAAAAMPARALLVRYQGTLTVWRQEGVRLPERFAVAEQSTVLRTTTGEASGTYAVRVREVIVGLLHWRAPAPPAEDERERLEALLRCAGLVLLNLGLTHAAPLRPREVRGNDTMGEGEHEEARAYAQVLAEDLELYLRRERAAEVAEARRLEDAWERFQVEVERCRRGYLERHPQQGAIGEASLREAMQRLQR